MEDAVRDGVEQALAKREALKEREVAQPRRLLDQQYREALRYLIYSAELEAAEGNYTDAFYHLGIIHPAFIFTAIGQGNTIGTAKFADVNTAAELKIVCTQLRAKWQETSRNRVTMYDSNGKPTGNVVFITSVFVKGNGGSTIDFTKLPDQSEPTSDRKASRQNAGANSTNYISTDPNEGASVTPKPSDK